MRSARGIAIAALVGTMIWAFLLAILSRGIW